MPSVFFSYSHKDEELRNTLEAHLAPMRRAALITTWHDRRIPAGGEWDHAIHGELEKANVILLLVSADFLNSDYCWGVEVTRAMQRHEAGSAQVIPVILRPCDWHDTPFGKLQALPTDGRPVVSFPDQDEAFLKVVQGIRAALPTRSSPAKVVSPVTPTNLPAMFSPRSSNLRLTAEFTEADRDRFRDETFEFISRFFENSLKELQDRNQGVEARFRPIDGRSFGAVVYRYGKTVATFGVCLGSARRGISGGIMYSDDENAPDNSYNGWLEIMEDSQSLFLKPSERHFMNHESPTHLSKQGAAEYLWNRLIEPLQEESRRH